MRVSAGCRGHTQASEKQGSLFRGEVSGCLWGAVLGGSLGQGGQPEPLV